ncbi:MAG: hypothetical protein V4719_17880 [Planctomycetota bacterium]
MDSAPPPETQAFLSDVADEMEAAAAQLESANGSASKPCENGEKPSRNKAFGSKLLYTASYTLSYGVCFPVFLVARYVPKNNQFVEGLVDGGASAQRAADNLLHRPVHETASIPTPAEAVAST